MRDKIFMICLLFLLMAAIPLCFVIQKSGTGSSKTTSATALSADYLAGQTTALCDGSFSDEAIRAVAVIQKTNAAAGQSEEEISNDITDNELFVRTKAITDSVSEILTYNGKAVFVPVSACSNGNTQKSEKFPFLEGVASPWDCFSEAYKAESVCEGVSLNGIKTLCNRGLSAREALRYYLPQLELSDCVTK